MKTSVSHKTLVGLALLGLSVSPSWAAVTGRYVRLEIPEIPSFGSNQYAMSHMSEIEVHSGGKNVALQSTPSSSAGTRGINALINGSRDWLLGDFGTGKQVNPWIELDLGASTPVDSIVIVTKGGADRKEPLMWLLSVLDEQRKLIWYQRTDLAGYPHTTTLSPASMKGRFVGQPLPPKAGAWYQVDQEQSQERNFQLAHIEIPPLPDAERRKAIFNKRESKAEIERLCRQLHAAVQPEHPSLNHFKARFDAGDFQGALTAYRDLFFDRLANPEKYGIPKELSNCVGGLGKRTPVIHSLIAEEAMRNRRVTQIRANQYVADVGAPGATRWAPRESIPLVESLAVRRARQAASGTQTPPKPSPEEQSQEREVLFFQNPEHTHGPRFVMFDELINSYAATGKLPYLERWMDYLDDWCLFGRSDVLNSRQNLVMASEASPVGLFNDLDALRFLHSKRPELATAIRPSTLARYALSLVEDLPPYLIRARRAEIANWGATSVTVLQVTALMLPEFRCMQDYARECVRLGYSGFLHQRAQDGENLEGGDYGHRYTDFSLGLRMTLHLSPLMPLEPQFPYTTPLAFQHAADLMKTVFRSHLTRVTPGADQWPRWAGVPGSIPAMDLARSRSGFLNHAWRDLGSRACLPSGGAALPTFADLVIKEPDAAERLGAIMDYPPNLWPQLVSDPSFSSTGKFSPEALKKIEEARKSGRPAPGKPYGNPQRTSDPAPYSGMYFLRDSWLPGSEHLMLFATRERSGDHDQFSYTRESAQLGFGAMRYDLLKDERTLLSSEAIVVDKKAPNASHNAVLTGGKTTYSMVPDNHVVDTRFHCSDRVNLAEARRNDPYSRMSSVRGDWYNIWRPNPGVDPIPITGITAFRQIFHLKGEGVWIVADRLEDANPKPHEYATFWTYPAAISPKGLRKSITELAAINHPLIEEKADSVRTAIPGATNVSSRFFGPQFQRINRLDANGNYVTLDKPQLQILKEALDQKGPKSKTAEEEVLQLDEDAAKSYGLRQVGILWKGSGNQALVTLHNTRPAVAEPSRQFENDLKDVEKFQAPGGVTGFRAVTPSGTRVEFQSGPNRSNALSQGLAQAQGESLLLVEKAGQLSGIALGTDGSLLLRGKRYNAPTADFEYALDAQGHFTATPIYRAIDTVQIEPAQNVFTERASVSFSIPTQDTSDIEFRYTLDGSDPTLESPLYSKPFEITKDTYVKVRPFRKGLTQTPFNIPCELAGKTVGALYRKEAMRPAVAATGKLQPGLDAEYLEGTWPTLFGHAGVPGVLPAMARAAASGLLVPGEVKAMRKTDKAYAVRYSGYLQAPADGIYTFHAPKHLYTTSMDAGFDLRVWVDGEEWFPSPTLHSENAWSIPLQKGLHNLRVCYVDYRWKTFKNEYWMDWQEGQMWQGTPVLEVTSADGKKQPLPAQWLLH
ncbi:MAG: hypothetical protein RLZZ399_1229 [Verrucomicrobiota bacterium]|jgi:hypothetical protein